MPWTSGLMRVIGITAVLAVAAALVTMVGPRLGQAPWKAGSGDVATIANLADVKQSAVHLTEDGAVIARWAHDRLTVLLARREGAGWRLDEVAGVAAARPANTSSNITEVVACSNLGLARPVFIYGQFIVPGADGLEVEGVDGVGGRDNDGSFVFAVAKASAGARFWILDSTGKFLAPNPWPFAPRVPAPDARNAVSEGLVPDSTTC